MDPPVGVGWPGGEARTCLLGQLTHSPHPVLFLFPTAVLLFQGSLFEVTHRVPDVSIRVQMVGSLGDAGGGAEWRGRRVIEMRRCSMWAVSATAPAARTHPLPVLTAHCHACPRTHLATLRWCLLSLPSPPWL